MSMYKVIHGSAHHIPIPDGSVQAICKQCGKPIDRKNAVFCSLNCKGEWQRTQKPVDKEWLEQKYLVEGLGAYAIAKLVNRNPKQVWNWIKDYEIPLRKRTWSIEPDTQPYHDPGWLKGEYVGKKRSSQEIADQFGVTGETISLFLKRYSISRRTMSEARSIKHWGQLGEQNPMYGKRGAKHHNWKGGSTPERQAFYSSLEWAAAVKVVWQRDNATCQRCGVKKSGDNKVLLMHIHHIVSFLVKELRAEPSNLVLLCADCHHWVHSNDNANREFISE